MHASRKIHLFSELQTQTGLVMKFLGCIGSSGRIGLVMSMSLILLMAADRSAFGYTPTDPIVTKMVEQGVAYLDTLTDNDFGGGDAFLDNCRVRQFLLGTRTINAVTIPIAQQSSGALKVAKSVVSSLSKGGGDEICSEANVCDCDLLCCYFAEVDSRWL